MIDPLFLNASAVFIALFFLLSGIHKAMHYSDFVQTLMDYQLLPDRLAAIAAMVLSLAEITIGCALMFSVTVLPLALLPSAAAAALFLALYSLAMAANIYRGIHIDCGCTFQQREIRLSRWHLLRNALLIGLALLTHLPATDRVLNPLDAVNTLATIMGLGLLYLSTENLLANRAHINDGDF